MSPKSKTKYSPKSHNSPQRYPLISALEQGAEAFLPQLLVEQKTKAYTLVLDLDETLVHCANPNTQDQPIINVRPGALDFIKTMSELYEVVIFTAGTKEYADLALKSADPNGLVSHRLYREHAIQRGSVFVKDISKLGRDLRKTIIIDNVVENFQLQPENGIFVNSWTDDAEDDTLIKLVPILKQIVKQKISDVRIALRHYRDSQMRTLLNKGKASVNSYY